MEDDLEQQFFWCQQLKDVGHDVTACGTASEAFEALSETGFDVLITDIFVRKGQDLVPEGGLRLINRVRLAQLPPAPVITRPLLIIAMSGGYTSNEGGLNLLMQAEDLGADVCLSKPVAPTKMIEALSGLLA